MVDAHARQAPCAACGAVATTARPVAFRKDGFEIVRCTSCGLLFRAELPSRDDLAWIYGPEYFRDGGAGADGYADYLRDEPLHRGVARARLALLAGFAPAEHALLDVGAAAGFFVDEASRAGWDAQGLDISGEMVAWGRDRLHVRLMHGSLESAALADGSLGVVTMWDYLEHSLDPFAELERCRALLAGGGLLALSTGDASSAVARLSGSRWHLLTPRHHTYFFTANALQVLLRRVGLDVLSVGHPGSRYSIQHLAYKLGRLVRVPVPAPLARRGQPSGIGRVAIPVNLFDIMTVVARKPVTRNGPATT